MVIQSNPKAIPQVVVERYPNVIRVDTFSEIGTPNPE